MADRRLCSFRVGELLLGIEALKVQEVLRCQELTRVPLAPAAIRGLVNLRGQIVTAIDLRVRLGLPEAAWASQLTSMQLVVCTAEGLVSLLVDEIGDVLTLAEDAFEPPPETLGGDARALIMGAYKLPDRLLLALDSDLVACVAAEEMEGTCHR